jgi:hypothetical protein
MSPLFIIAILIGLVLGFQRGWRREIISLVFVLLATFLVNVKTSDFIGSFLSHIPPAITTLLGGTASPTPSQGPLITGWVPSLLIFAGVIVLGYFVGNKVFPKPATPPERIIGIIPGILSGAFVLWYLEGFLQSATGNSTLPLNFADADPGKYVPIIFVIGVLALVVAVIAARAKKAPAKK